VTGSFVTVSHAVKKNGALTCTDCHTQNGRLDFAALGYSPAEAQHLATLPVAQASDVAVFVLDDFGAVHTGGAANHVALTGGPYFGWNIARALQLTFGLPACNESGTGVMVLDGYGAVHTFSSSRPAQNFYFYPDPGAVAEDFAVFQEMRTPGVPGEIGLFVLDRTGRLWSAGCASWQVAADASIQPPLPGTTQYAVDVTLADDTGTSGWIMDNMGNVYPFGGALDPVFPVSTQSDWVDLEQVDGQLLRMNTSGGLTWSGTPVEGWQFPMVDGGLMVDFAVEPGLGLVGLDRYGALYTAGNALVPPAGDGPPYFGAEAARALQIAPPVGAAVNAPTGP